MRVLLSFLLFVSSSALLAEVQSTGETDCLHCLTPISDEQWISRTFIKYESSHINFESYQEPSTKIRQYITILEEEIAYKLSKMTFFSINMKYANGSTAVPRYSSSDVDKYHANGFSQPSFNIYSRRHTSKKKGNSFIDLFLKYSPYIEKQKVGKSNGNNLEGRNVFHFGVSKTTLEDYWNFRINLFYTYYGEGEQKNLAANGNNKMKAYSESELSLEVQHQIENSLYIRAGIGLRLIEDQDIESNNSTATLQQGTGSRHYVGLVKRQSPYVIIFKIERLANDYFIKSDANAEGDYAFNSISFELLKEF